MVAAGWNGAAGHVSVASNVDHIKPKNRIAVDGAGVPLSVETLAWHTYCTAGAPASVVAMTQPLFDQVKEYCNSTIALFDIV